MRVIVLACPVLLSLMALGRFGCNADDNGQQAGSETGTSQAAADENTRQQPIPGDGPIAEESSVVGVAGDPLVPPIVLGAEPPAGRQAQTGGEISGLPLLGRRSGVLAPDFSSDGRAHFHPHGRQVCASGCAASNHPTPELQRDQFEQLLAAYGTGPMDETCAALESLLFFGRQTEAFLGLSPLEQLDREHEAFLRRELTRTHALVSFRIVDEHDAVRVEMHETRVPLDRRHVFDMDTRDLPPLVTSGTVKRVGLHHLWTRI